MAREIGGRLARLASLLALSAALVLGGAAARAEIGWIKEEVRLNLRTGPGPEFRILGVMKTGDEVQVLERGEGWTRVRVEGMEDGWIPAGYLQPEPTAGVLLAQRDAELATLREKLDAVSKEASELRGQTETFSGRDAQRASEITRLTRENLAFRAGARWPEWFTGAGILTAGMILGGLVHRSAGRRRASRVRL